MVGDGYGHDLNKIGLEIYFTVNRFYVSVSRYNASQYNTTMMLLKSIITTYSGNDSDSDGINNLV